MNISSTSTSSITSSGVLDELATFLGLLTLSTRRVTEFDYNSISSSIGIGSAVDGSTSTSTSSSGSIPGLVTTIATLLLGNVGDYPYEAFIATISILFFRYTVIIQKNEPLLVRFLFCIVLCILTYTRKSYELIISVELFSYVLSYILMKRIINKNKNKHKRQLHDSNVQVPKIISTNDKIQDAMYTIGSLIIGAGLSFTIGRCIVSHQTYNFLSLVIPNFIKHTSYYLFPIEEITKSYIIVCHFINPQRLNNMIYKLLFITFHIQCGMGYLGIDFLRKEQERKNQLIRMDIPTTDSEQKDNNTNNNTGNKDNKKNTASTQSTGRAQKEKLNEQVLLQRAKKFNKNAGPFILFVAVPYMIQIIIYGNMNQFMFACVQDELHRLIRVDQVFDQDNNFVSLSTGTPLSSSNYASSMNNIVQTTYDIVNRKLFSLPKIALLPTMIIRQPMLLIQVFPFIFVSDYIKASVVSYMTTHMELLQNEIKDLSAIRTKIESFDTKNAELLQRSGTNNTKARSFTHKRWSILCNKIQSRKIVSDLIRRSKDFFAFLQRNFIFAILIDCALANLIAIGKIMTSEVFVFSRAIEDTVDLLLMRSRSEAELARLLTDIDKLNDLSNLWYTTNKDNSSRKLDEVTSNKVICQLQSHDDYVHEPHHSIESINIHTNKKALTIRNLQYTRGTASARIDHLVLVPAVYALTGANGSGKSTLFRILMSCPTNNKITDLPSSINLLTPIEPIIENDDLLREKSCIEGDINNTDSDNDDLSCTESEVSIKDQQQEQPHVPKLLITMPSSTIVEISQNFYWPLFTKPIDWIYEEHVTLRMNEQELLHVTRKVAEELHSLEFFQSAKTNNDNDSINTSTTTEEENRHVSDATNAEITIQRIMSELIEEKEDWFSNLSGGQKSKVELVRTVFLQETCPDVLLIDETMAPLDPASKELVMAKLKYFCSNSIIIVIYHTDVGQGKEIEGGITVDCVPSNNFFDGNIHLENGNVHIRDTC